MSVKDCSNCKGVLMAKAQVTVDGKLAVALQVLCHNLLMYVSLLSTA